MLPNATSNDSHKVDREERNEQSQTRRSVFDYPHFCSPLFVLLLVELFHCYQHGGPAT